MSMLRPRIDFRDRRRSRPLLHLVPNMFTIMSLCAGMTGLRYALDDRWKLAVGLIVVAMVLDGLDGRSARLLKATSKLGGQLDSLADFLSFGVAPAMIVYLWCLNEVRAIGWAIAMLFAACCALRLARFNVESEDEAAPRWRAKFFTGIPAPAAAGLALLPLSSSFVIGSGLADAWLLNALMMLAVAVMMVSRVPTFSIKKIHVAPNWVLPTLLASVVILVLLITETWAMLTLIGIGYLISIPFAVVSARRLQQAEAGDGHGAAAGDGDGDRPSG